MDPDFEFACNDGPIKFNIHPKCRDKERIGRLIKEHSGELTDSCSADFVVGGPALVWRVGVLDPAWVTKSVEAGMLLPMYSYLGDTEKISSRHGSLEQRDLTELLKAGILNTMYGNFPDQMFNFLNKRYVHKSSEQWKTLYLRSHISEVVAKSVARLAENMSEDVNSLLSYPSDKSGSAEDVMQEDAEHPPSNDPNDGIQDQSDNGIYGEWRGIEVNRFTSPSPPESKHQFSSESQSSDSRTISRVSFTGEGDGDADGGPGEAYEHWYDQDDDDDEVDEEDVSRTETADEGEQEDDDWKGDPELLANAPDLRRPSTHGFKYSKVDYRNMARFVRRLGAAPSLEEWNIFNNQLPEDERRSAKSWQRRFKDKSVQIMGTDRRYDPNETRRGDKIGRGWRATDKELIRMARFVNKVGFGADGRGPKVEQWKTFWAKRVNGKLVNQDRRKTAEAWHTLYYNRRREIRGIAAGLRASPPSFLTSAS